MVSAYITSWCDKDNFQEFVRRRDQDKGCADPFDARRVMLPSIKMLVQFAQSIKELFPPLAPPLF